MYPHIDQLLVTLSPLVGHTGQVGVSLFAVLSHHAAVIEWVFPEEALGVVVAVNIDLGQSIMGGRLLTAFMDARLQPGQQQLQSVKEKGYQNSQTRMKHSSKASCMYASMFTYMCFFFASLTTSFLFS